MGTALSFLSNNHVILCDYVVFEQVWFLSFADVHIRKYTTQVQYSTMVSKYIKQKCLNATAGSAVRSHYRYRYVRVVLMFDNNVSAIITLVLCQRCAMCKL
jgi:hypothetical protein